jgi:hypothetical protein
MYGINQCALELCNMLDELGNQAIPKSSYNTKLNKYCFNLNKRTSLNTFVCQLPTNADYFSKAQFTLRIASKGSHITLNPKQYFNLNNDDSYIIDLEKKLINLENKLRNVKQFLSNEYYDYLEIL